MSILIIIELGYFETIKFEDYKTEQVFDLVHARNVIPFVKNKPQKLARMLKMGQYVWFTFFGPNDPWGGKRHDNYKRINAS